VGGVLVLKPGHDGSVAFVADGELVFSLEGENHAFERNGLITPPLIDDALLESPEFPDVVAIGGCHKVLPGSFEIEHIVLRDTWYVRDAGRHTLPRVP
jgi:predicted NodU family carbamoyl transferase